MKKILLIITALFSTLGISNIYAAEALNMTMKDGEVHSFLLSDKPTITFSGSLLIVTTSDNVKVEYDLYNVKEYSFGSPSSGINDIGIDSETKYDGEKIVFSGVSNANNVKVVSIDGTIHNPETTTANGTVMVNLSSLPSGTYIVKANNTTMKIFKR